MLPGACGAQDGLSRAIYPCWVHRHTEWKLRESPAICEASMPPSGRLEELGGEQKGASVGLSPGLARGNEGPWEAKPLPGRVGVKSGNRKVSLKRGRWY